MHTAILKVLHFKNHNMKPFQPPPLPPPPLNNTGSCAGNLKDRLLQCSLCGAPLEGDPEDAACIKHSSMAGVWNSKI